MNVANCIWDGSANDHNSSVLVESGHEMIRDQCLILQPVDECGQLHYGVEMCCMHG
jgi:hypothetical protein